MLAAATALAANAPGVDARNVAIADPGVPRPDVKPCVVQLFADEAFGVRGEQTRMDATPHPFDYRPPRACQGPWAKVVLEAKFAVDAGYQYDRTASIWLGDVNLYFGTTQEPTPDTAPHWEIQRDLTGYAALLRQPAAGAVLINNWLDGVRTSVIHASARLLFYPATAKFPAPRVPDAVYPLNAAGALPAKLPDDTAALARTLVFPRNTARAYLDVIAEPQSHDEDYYACLGQGPADKPAVCSVRPGDQRLPAHPVVADSPYREVLVSIDGTPAGLAPVAPLVYTGGLDPRLWQPTPANQTLNFMPWRIDLTPFAGELADGKPHAVAVRVLNAHDFFAVAAAVLVYRDAQARDTRGAVTRNTLVDRLPAPSVKATVDARGDGSLVTRAATRYVIEGYITTPTGRVASRVGTAIDFDNVQAYATLPDGVRRHVVRQHARVATDSRTGSAEAPQRQVRRTAAYELAVNELQYPVTDPHLEDASVQVQQDFVAHVEASGAGLPVYLATVRNRHRGADHSTYDARDRASLAGSGQASVQTFTFDDSLGNCYGTSVRARDGRVTAVDTGVGCLAGKPSLDWFVHADGSPDGFGWRADAAR